jgi:thiamine-monophosphate kinase
MESSMTDSLESSEERLIASILAGVPCAGPAILLGAGHDAAVLRPSSGALDVVTTDAMVESVHWDDRLTPADVGYKLVAVNASDLGAMGARPGWALLCVALPDPPDTAWLSDFTTGLAEGLLAFDLALAGGDTVRAPGNRRFLSLTAGGRAARVIGRRGAVPGDVLWVTGWLGAAAAALLKPSPPEQLRIALARPRPPVAFGARLGESGLVNAMMDLSDGLACDLGRLCRASGVGVQVDETALPVHPLLLGSERTLALTGGEDYGLCFAAGAASTPRLLHLAAASDVSITAIGRFDDGDGPRLANGSWPSPSFEHFGHPGDADAF